MIKSLMGTRNLQGRTSSIVTFASIVTAALVTNGFQIPTVSALRLGFSLT